MKLLECHAKKWLNKDNKNPRWCHFNCFRLELIMEESILKAPRLFSQSSILFWSSHEVTSLQPMKNCVRYFSLIVDAYLHAWIQSVNYIWCEKNVYCAKGESKHILAVCQRSCRSLWTDLYCSHSFVWKSGSSFPKAALRSRRKLLVVSTHLAY